jgi:hypothetical protein
MDSSIVNLLGVGAAARTDKDKLVGKIGGCDRKRVASIIGNSRVEGGGPDVVRFTKSGRLDSDGDMLARKRQDVLNTGDRVHMDMNRRQEIDGGIKQGPSIWGDKMGDEG